MKLHSKVLHAILDNLYPKWEYVDPYRFPWRLMVDKETYISEEQVTEALEQLFEERPDLKKLQLKFLMEDSK